MYNNIISPSSEKGIKKTIEEIEQYKKEGRLHILYDKYLEIYGQNHKNNNIVLPFEINNRIVDIYIINHIDDTERIASKHIKKVPNLKLLLFDSIISTTNNNLWSEQRRCFSSAFTMDNLKNIIPESVDRSFTCVEKLWEISKQGTSEVNINDFFLNETMAQLQQALFGFKNEFQEETNKKIRDALGRFEKEYGMEYIKKFYKEIKISEGPLSLAFKGRNNIIPQPTTLEKIGNAIIFTFAGHDTTGHTLSWLIYELAKNNKYQKILHNEVDQFWKDQCNDVITYKNFKRLPFMTKCIMETLRLWPALTNGTYRELEEDDYITDFDGNKLILEKGTWIQIPNWTRHRNKELWGEDADIFNPYREFKEDEDWDGCVIASYNPNSPRFSPFTYGPRDCIGKNFAQIEMRIILLFLLQKFEFTLATNQMNMDEEWLSLNTLTMGPRDPYNSNKMGLYVNINKRDKYTSKL
jgi:cytochrome P450